jgi:hypothetical protein
MSPFLTRIPFNKGLGSRISVSAPAAAAPISATLVYDLDAANYAAVPTTGSTVAGTGAYTITVANAGSITYSSDNGGSWVKSNNVQADNIYGGPNYATGQSYTVFMAYKLSATSAGRILNSQDEARNWLLGSFQGRPSAFYPNFSVNLPGGSTDTVWHLDWGTWNAATFTGQVYTSTNTAPTNYAFTATSGGGGGFIQLRMFSRASPTVPQVQTGNIGFVKVYDGVLTLSEIQSLHATYKARFGY